MVAYRKFEFDNFVITEDEDISSSSSNEEEVITEVVEEIIEPEFESEPVIEPEPEPVVEVITYTEEELNEAKQQSEQLGYDKGYQAKSEESDNFISGLLIEVNNKLSDILATREELQKQLEQDFLKLNQIVLQKLLPELSNENAQSILNRFLEKNFPNIRSEPKLSFYFHPDIAATMQQQIAKLAHIHDFEGKISLHKDSKLEKASCRIEWENGGVCNNSDKLLEKIDNLLEETTSEN